MPGPAAKASLVLAVLSALIAWWYHQAASQPSAVSISAGTPPAAVVPDSKPTPGGATQNPSTAAQTTAMLAEFQLHHGIKDTFDQFILAADEPEPARMKHRYKAHAQTQFSRSSASYALDVFSRYVNYKVALADADMEVNTDYLEIQDIALRLDAREQLRLQFFSAREYDYLFARDASSDRHALDRLQIARDPGLDKAARREAILARLDTLPEQERQAFAPTLNMHTLSQIKQQFADSTSRYNAIAAEFGHAAAERFTALWEKQAAWQRKQDAYQAYRQQLADTDWSPARQQAALAEYVQQHFSPAEQKRLPR